MIKAGELRHRADILKPKETVNIDGNPKEEYEVFKAGVPVGFQKAPWGREFWEAQAQHGISVRRLMMRYMPGIREDMRIKVNNRTYEIIPPIDNVADLNRELVLIVKEVI
jgi:head-tail adaptor